MQSEIRYKGIVNDVNEYSVADGYMAEMMNLVPEADGLRVVPMPSSTTDIELGDVEVIHIHHPSDNTTQYIGKRYNSDTNTYSILFHYESSWQNIITDVNEVGEVASIGNTIVLQVDGKQLYALWRSDSNEYCLLGDKPPQTVIQFGLQGTFCSYPNDNSSSAKPDSWEKYGNDSSGHLTVEDDWIVWNDDPYYTAFPCEYNGTEGDRKHYTGGGFSAKQIYESATNTDYKDSDTQSDADRTATVIDTLTNLIMGAVNSFMQTKATDKNKFMMPFLVRYAYRLYDGTHVMHSTPVLMVPNSKAPVVWWRQDSSIARRFSTKDSYAHRVPYVYARASANVAALQRRMVQVPSELAYWKDIITGIDIYVSAPLYNYDQSEKVYGWEKVVSDASTVNNASASWGGFFSDGNITNYNTSGEVNVYGQRLWYNMQTKVYPNRTYYKPTYRFMIPEFTEAEMADKVRDCSNFYKISTINFEDLVWTDESGNVKTCTDPSIMGMKEVTIEDGILNSLTSREQLEDDYKSSYTKSAGGMYVYNARLNLCDVSETAQAGANMILQSQPTNYLYKDSYMWKAIIEYNKNGKRVFLQVPDSPVNYGYDANFPRYIFVPDADAKKIYITKYRVEPKASAASEESDNSTDSRAASGATGEVSGETTEPSGEISGETTDFEPVDDGTFTPSQTGADAESVDNTEKGDTVIEDPDVYPFPDFIGNKFNTDTYEYTFDSSYCITLQEHEFLNGAVWFKGYSNVLPSQFTGKIEPVKEYTTNYPNKVYTSEPLNPFTFVAENINTIGTGRILALRAAVTPVRQNQAGQLSMYALSEDGIWAMQVSSTTGGWSGYEIVNGDVCEDKTSVCQLDNAIAYRTKQGIMLLQGAQSICISAPLDGVQKGVKSLMNSQTLYKLMDLPPMVNAATFVRDCNLCYDYTNQRLIAYNGGADSSLIYSLRSREWGAAVLEIGTAVADYPRTYYNSTKNKFIELSQVHDYTQRRQVYLITRPLKMEMPDVLKTIESIHQRGSFPKNKVLAHILWGSRDLQNWQLIDAVKGDLTALHGSGYKYFKVMLVAEVPSDSKVVGATIVTSPKQTDKVR